MIHAMEDPEEWAAKYGLLKVIGKIYQCPKCGVDITVSIPFAIKGYRGLQSEDHGCGKEYVRSVAIPVGKTRDKWNNVLHGDE